MSHVRDEDLVLHVYGEETPAGDSGHLEECRDCAARLAEMRRLLWAVDAQPVPVRDASYGARVWQRLRPRLEENRAAARVIPFPSRTWALAAAAAAIAVVAFLLGRQMPPNVPVTPAMPAAGLTAAASERILLDAVSRHFDRSERVLLQASNAPGDESAGFASIRSGAEGLIADNRLIRQSAVRSGDAAVAQTLEELERSLMEIANGPTQPSPEQIEALQRRLEAQGVLFKIRVLSPRVQVPMTSPGPAAERL